MPSNSSDEPIDETTEDDFTDATESEAEAEAAPVEQPTPAKPSAAAAKPRGKAAKPRTTTAAKTAKPAPADSGKSESSTGGNDISLTISKTMLKKVAVGVVVIALLAVVGVGVWQWVSKSRQLATFDEAETASNAFVTALVSTSNADNAGNYKDILGPLATGDLRTRLEKDRADTEKNVADLKLKVSSKILVSAVESFTAESAKTLVMAEVTGTSAQLPTGASNLMVFRLELSKVDGKWLVSKFDGPPGSRNGQIDPSQSLPGASTTTTPAPAPATSAPPAG